MSAKQGRSSYLGNKDALVAHPGEPAAGFKDKILEIGLVSCKIGIEI